MTSPFSIFDCSNSPERPLHLNGVSPIINDVMRYLHENEEDYYCKFVDSKNDARVIITNDVFEKSLINLNIPLVKRMCSPFWQKEYSEKNESLNAAAQSADRVIFISEYSKEKYHYDNGIYPIDHQVILNWVDPKVFTFIHNMKEKKFTFAACANDWSRKEKRLSDVIKFAELYPDVQIFLIGKNECPTPSNIINLGYVSNPDELANLLNMANAFLNLSYRDAAPKVVAQAIACGLPVLFANSGGTDELVGDNGVGIKDDSELRNLDYVPELDIKNIKNSYIEFMDEFDDLKLGAEEFDSKLMFRKMIDSYFTAITTMIPEEPAMLD